ncbi:MAG: hypothetical protein Q8P41_14475 [Pseudomonadota bacterium]|nr:hypothetical protein [Pseudomonadota bacterium]
MFRLTRLFPLFALVGCAGSVQVEDIDPFGAAASAVWFHWDDSDYDSLLLTNVMGACGKWQAYAEASKELDDAVEDMDENDYCEDAKEPSLAVARIANDLFHEGTHMLALTVYEDGSTEPEEETYEVGDPRQALGGTVTYYGASPYAAILADWDEDEDWEDNCGIDTDDLDADIDSWSLSDGELELLSVKDEGAAAGALEAELVDEDGDRDGDISARFTATWCEVDL